MGFGHTLKRIAGYGIKPKTLRNFRKKIGLHSSNKWLRQIKRSLHGRGGSFVASSQPVSADGYRHQARTLSQLTGGI